MVQITLTYRGEGAAFDGLTDHGQAITLDGSPALGGAERGPRPMEMVLFGLAGCAAMDVLHIIRKGRRELTHAIVTARGERADAVPAVFSAVHLQFELGGVGLTLPVIERAVALSVERYCSVAHMLSPHVEISASVELVTGSDTMGSDTMNSDL